MRALFALLLLGACAPTAPDAPAPTPDGAPIDELAFDADAWIAAAEAADTPAEQVALSAQLLDAVDWRAACGEDDPTAPGRGTLAIVHLDDVRSLAAITCQRFAYQSAFALVDARGGRPPRLVRSLGVTEVGRVTDEVAASYFGLLSHDRAAAPSQFSVLAKSAGHGGCGTDVRYRLLSDGGAEVEAVRAHPDCSAPLPPADWPQTYP